MAKKIEMLNDLNEVVHPLTSSDCVIMENGKTLEEVMGDGIATPTVTHEGASFQVGVGDSNIEVVDGDVAGMTLEGQTYQNILPKPTTLIMETDEKEFKINDKIDNNIVLDDNVAEIATIKGQTYVNAVQEESASEYVAIDEELNGQSITTTGKPEGYVKNATLEGLTLVNTIQEPSEANSVVLDLDADINAQDATIDNTIQGGIHGAILKGQTLVNLIDTENGYGMRFQHDGTVDGDCYTITTMSHGQKVVVNQAPSGWRYFGQEIKLQMLKKSTKYFVCGEFQGISRFQFMQANGLKPISIDGDVINNRYAIIETAGDLDGNITSQCLYGHISLNIDSGSVLMCNDVILVEYQEGMENWDIPYFEGIQSVEVPSVKTTGKNLIGGTGYYIGLSGADATSGTTIYAGDGTLKRYSYITKCKPNTTYILTTAGTANRCGLGEFDEYPKLGAFGTKWSKDNSAGTLKITTKSTTNYLVCYCYFNEKEQSQSVMDEIVRGLIVQLEESSTKTSYEPYKSSTLTTDKNIFDGQLAANTLCDTTGEPSSELLTLHKHTLNYMSCNANEQYELHIKPGTSGYYGVIKVYYYDKDKNYLKIHEPVAPGLTSTQENKIQLTTPNNSNIAYMRFRFYKPNDVTAYTEATVDYLTIKQVYTLRGIGDVKDELNLLTGELTQRIGEIVLDGSNNNGIVYRKYSSNSTDSNSFTSVSVFSIHNIPNKKLGYGRSISNNFENSNDNRAFHNEHARHGLYSDHPTLTNIYVAYGDNNDITLNDFKTYLSNNPIVLQYELETPVVKTVDLSIVDQDNNPVKSIQTHPTLTHITTSSNGLIPFVSIPSQLKYPTIIKPSTQYTLKLKRDVVDSANQLTVNVGGASTSVTSDVMTITTPDTLTSQDIVLTGKNNVISQLQLIEGDVTGIDYPFFEGMLDVKSPKLLATGKNL